MYDSVWTELATGATGYWYSIMTDFTSNFNFELVPFDTDPWHTKEHNNWHIVDAIMKRYITISNVQGVWTNATTVAVGDRYIDVNADTIWEVLVTHVTKSTGLFAADRTANPTYWQGVTVDSTSRGTWTVGTAYKTNDYVVDVSGGYSRYGVVIANHTAVTSYDTGVTDSNIITLINVKASSLDPFVYDSTVPAINVVFSSATDFIFTANKFEAQTGSTIDLNGTEFILDADADTSITADTDDQIDIKIAGADDFQFTPNTFTVLSGSTLAVASGATIANSGTATGFGVSLDNDGDNRVVTGTGSGGLNAEANLSFDGSTLAATGNVTATGTFEPSGDTSTGDNAAIGYTSAEGLILTGQGSTNDVTIKNDADADVLKIPTGTTNVGIVGNLNIDDGGSIVVGRSAAPVSMGGSAATLQSVGTAEIDSTIAAARWSADADGPRLIGFKSRNASIGSTTIVQDGDNLLDIVAYGDDAAADYFEAPAAMIRMSVDGTPGTNDMPGRMTFHTSADGGQALNERMRIDSSGNVTLPTAGAGIYLGVTSATAANLLDDYEEGSWTPALTCSSSNPTISSGSAGTGKYRKIGSTVFIYYSASFVLSNVGSGTVEITGLPFTAGSDVSVYAGSPLSGRGFGYNGTTVQVVPRIAASGTGFKFNLFDINEYPGSETMAGSSELSTDADGVNWYVCINYIAA
jgi:hypothetical protein